MTDVIEYLNNDVIDYLNDVEEEGIKEYKIKNIILNDDTIDNNSFLKYYDLLDSLEYITIEYFFKFDNYLKYLYDIVHKSKEIEFVCGTIFKLKNGKFHSYEEPAIIEYDLNKKNDIIYRYFLNGKEYGLVDWEIKRQPYLRRYKIKQLINNG